jgi:undecaprenyl-diphosphatase
MLEWLLDFEREWFLALNGLHTWWLDRLMLAFAGVGAWFPLFLVPLYFAVKRRRERVSMLLCTLLAGAASTAVAEGIVKPCFRRLRPVHHPLFMEQVRVVNEYVAAGNYGFISGHSTSAFAFAVMSALAVRNRWYSAAIFAWALMMGYSRIYLGAHFITDVIPGIIAGSLIGWLIYLLYKLMQNKKQKTVLGSARLCSAQSGDCAAVEARLQPCSAVDFARPEPCFYCDEGWSLRRAKPSPSLRQTKLIQNKKQKRTE